MKAFSVGLPGREKSRVAPAGKPTNSAETKTRLERRRKAREGIDDGEQPQGSASVPLMDNSLRLVEHTVLALRALWFLDFATERLHEILVTGATGHVGSSSCTNFPFGARLCSRSVKGSPAEVFRCCMGRLEEFVRIDHCEVDDATDICITRQAKAQQRSCQFHVGNVCSSGGSILSVGVKGEMRSLYLARRRPSWCRGIHHVRTLFREEGPCLRTSSLMRAPSCLSTTNSGRCSSSRRNSLTLRSGMQSHLPRQWIGAIRVMRMGLVRGQGGSEANCRSTSFYNERNTRRMMTNSELEIHLPPVHRLSKQAAPRSNRRVRPSKSRLQWRS
jgi:hypothetical protein